MRIALAVVSTVSFTTMLVAAEPFVGTWKLNVGQSKPLGNQANLASETMTISSTGPNTFTTTIDSVTKSGEKRHQEVVLICDGKEHTATGVGFNQKGASEICQRIGDSTRKMIRKTDGEFRNELTSTVSPDGRVLTNRTTNANGEGIQVFDRQ